MTLAELIERFDGLELPPMSQAELQQPLTQLSVDSRDVIEGSVFIALAGSQTHGMSYLEQAINNGACCVLAEKSPGLVKMDDISSNSDNGKQTEVPVIWVENLSEQCAELAKHFYHNPSQKLKVIGVTGTNGKTSTAHYIAQLLSTTGSKVALLGTLGNGWLSDLMPSQNTTLEVIALNRWLAYFVENGAEVVVMEVSSHAIALERISGIQFCGLALTQVTRDHLDFHQTEQAYQSVKRQLFEDYPHQFKVLNLEDGVGSSLAKQNADSAQQIGYAKDATLYNNADIAVLQVEATQTGFNGQLRILGHTVSFKVPLMGAFNLENMLCAIGVCVGLGMSAKQIEQALTHLRPVLGRMQTLSSPDQPSVVIDYAHTADALKALLMAVRAHLSQSNQQLWVVFGCGGNRDQGKRTLMGQVAEQYADQVVVTDDNPRYESPQQIVRQITSDMKQPYQVIHDRAEAISAVIAQANQQDVVVIAGKGHESTQEISGKKLPMQDEELVKQAYAVNESDRRQK